MSSTPMFPGAIKTHTGSISDTTGTSLITLVTAGSNGTRIDSISATSDDTVDAILTIYHSDGTTDFILGTLTVSAGSGTDGSTPSVDILNQTDLPFLRDDLALYLENGHSLKLGVSAVLSTGKKIDFVSICGDY